jgi:hypothetical protein
MEKLTRRRAIRSLTALGIASVGVGYYTWRWEPHWLEFTYPPLPISGLPNELAGCTLAQIADIHVGPQVDDAYLIESFRRVQEIDPDFVAFTGDWISYRSPQQFEQLRRVLEHFPHGRLATVGILGNHDYGRHWRMLDVADKVTDIARAAGVTILRNQAVTLSGLQFVGLDDLWSPRFDPWNCWHKNLRILPRWCSATIRIPPITLFGIATRAGFWRLARSNYPAIAACTSAAESAICCGSAPMSGPKFPSSACNALSSTLVDG